MQRGSGMRRAMILMCSHDNRMLLAKPDPSQCREERISVSSIIVVFPQVFIFLMSPWLRFYVL